MPLQIRQLKASLLKVGFSWRTAKGSHTYWTHPYLPEVEITIAGHDGDDAQHYQIKQIQNALNSLSAKEGVPWKKRNTIL